MKIETKELAGYLPYGLNFMAKGELYQMTEMQPHAIYEVWANVFFDEKRCEYIPKVNYRPSEMGRGFGINEIKPILHPLSDLTKEIEHNGERFVPYKAIEDLFGVENFSTDLTYQVRREDDGLVYVSLEKQNEILQKLHEWHFDIHNWIGQGLAIDINTLNHA